jgi:hypothetical protein
MKSMRMRWAGLVTRMGRREKCTKLWWECPKERDHSEDRGVDGRKGSEFILESLAGRVLSGFGWLRRGTGNRIFEHGDEFRVLWRHGFGWREQHERFSAGHKLFKYNNNNSVILTCGLNTYVIQLPIQHSKTKYKVEKAIKCGNKAELNKCNNLNTSFYREGVFKEDIFCRSLHISQVAVMHVAEGLCLNALLTLKVENLCVFSVVLA